MVERGDGTRGSLGQRIGFYGSVAIHTHDHPEQGAGRNACNRHRRSIVSFRRYAVSSLLLIALLVSSTAMFLPRDEDDSERPSVQPLALAPHSLIFIADDSALEEMATLEGWTGDGSESAPFVIENYEIAVSGSGVSGIEVWNTTAFLTVRDCTIQGDWNSDAGILFANVTNATAIENSCHSFKYGGVSLVSSSECVVTNNTCTTNSNGIYLQESDSSNITDNNLSGSDYGIYATGSSNNVFENNTCCNCDYGLYFRAGDGEVCSNNTLSGNNCSSCSVNGIFITRDCANNTIDRCICEDDRVGIWIHGSLSTVISNNTCSRNEYDEILLYDSSQSNVCDNLLSDNGEYGVRVDVCCYNKIFNNTFIDNNGADDTYDPSHIQALDDGGLNQWNSSGYGNYWSDWTGPDDNSDGIVDNPYEISTLPLAKDYYPLAAQPVPIPEFSSPIMPAFAMIFIVIAMLAYRKRKLSASP